MKTLAEMTLSQVLKRIGTGTSDEEDAEQVKRWVVDDRRGNIVKAYLSLSCNMSDVRQFIAKDLREGLAEQLLME